MRAECKKNMSTEVNPEGQKVRGYKKYWKMQHAQMAPVWQIAVGEDALCTLRCHLPPIRTSNHSAKFENPQQRYWCLRATGGRDGDGASQGACQDGGQATGGPWWLDGDSNNIVAIHFTGRIIGNMPAFHFRRYEVFGRNCSAK